MKELQSAVNQVLMCIVQFQHEIRFFLCMCIHIREDLIMIRILRRIQSFILLLRIIDLILLVF